MATRVIKAGKLEIENYKSQLRELFPIGSTVDVVISEVSRSGYGSRSFTVLVIDKAKYTHIGSGKRKGAPFIRNVSRMVATVTGMPFNDDMHSIRSHGSGMDMCFHMVYNLGRILYGDRSELTPSQKRKLTIWEREDKSYRGASKADAGYTLQNRSI